MGVGNAALSGHPGAKPQVNLFEQFNKVIDDIERLACVQRNRCLTIAGTAIATTTTKIKTVNTITYSIDGALKSKAGTDNFWTLGAAGANTNVADTKFQKYVLFIDAAGAASVLEGTQAATAAAVVLPALPASKAVVAVVTVQNASGAPFIPGTTALNTAGLTVTYTDGMDSGYLSNTAGMTAVKLG